MDNSSLQAKLQKYLYNQSFFKDDDDKVLYYIGLSSYNTLLTLYEFVQNDLKCTILSKFEQLILCFMRMRLGIAIMDLSNRFNVSKSTVSRIFLDCLDVLYIKLYSVVYWPERPELQISMPMCFRARYGKKITTIIDCFELFIDRPSGLTARTLTWSSYKNKNTIKFLIAITPQGTISFISKGWGGRTTEKHITEHSGFLRKLCSGDTVMADRGFDIADTIGSYGGTLEIPAFTRGKTQQVH